MKALYLKLKNIFIYIIIFSILRAANSIDDEIELTDNLYSNTFNIEKEKCFTFTLKLSEQKKEQLKDSYIHFSTVSKKISDMNTQQIIYSSKNVCPTISNADSYSLKSSKNSDLFSKFPDTNTDKLYLTVKCYSYPCSFDLKANIENEYVELNLDNNDSYSYYSTGDKLITMKFKILSSLNKVYTNNEKHVYTISVTNPGDLEYTELKLMKKGKKVSFNADSYKTPTSIVFTFVEENYMTEFSKDNFYVLEIQSLENQFISISIKTSKFYDNKLVSEILPNYYSKYSYLNSKNIQVNEECFYINEEYTKDNLLNNNEDFLYASIYYYTLPIEPNLKYNGQYKLPEVEFNEEQISYNLILKKESDIIPQLCFQLNDNKELAFMLEISHISKKNKNIDIYTPLQSGFLYVKTLNKNNLAFYTHNSDVHYSENLSFYLKILKGNPEMYIVPCTDYPNCYNDISQLKNDINAIKPNEENKKYTYSLKTNRQKDLSPYGNKQNLLYVYCPDQTEEYCQYEVSIYSELDQISLYPNDIFYSSKLKDESDLFRIHIPKGSPDVQNIKLSINCNKNLEFVFIEDNINSTLKISEESTSQKIYEFIPEKSHSIENQDFDILFNIKANENLDYSLEYKKSKSKNEKVLSQIEFGTIKTIPINSFPLRLFYILPNKMPNFKDLLLNFNIIENNNKIDTSKITFNSIIINNNKLNEINNTKNYDDVFDDSTSKKNLDLSTNSLVLNINKEYMNKIKNRINDKDEMVLYITINNSKNQKLKLKGELFLYYENTTDFIIPYNNYISSKLSINITTFKLYHLKLDNNKNKFIVDFSSNYAFDNDFKISFIDYDNNIDNIKSENLIKNSTNIKIQENNNKPGVNQFELTINDNNKKDLFLCVYSNVQNKDLSSINYIFKYSTSNSDDEKNRIKYELSNKDVKYTNNTDKKVIELEFEKIKKITNDNKTDYCLGDISIRKIKKKNKIDKEKLDTITEIQSKYKIINGNINDQNDKIKIELPDDNDISKNYYSIFINLPKEKEKFAYNALYIDKNKDKKEKDKDKEKQQNTILWIIVISTGSVVLLLIAIIIIICIIKNRKSNLENEVNTVSFKQESEQRINDNDDDEYDEALQ